MEETIRSFILGEILDGEESLEYDTPLFSEGLIASMGFLKLLRYLEKQFEVVIPMSEISTENFDTVAQIAALIAEKRVQD